ncbi:MAG TPA: APC family permease [Candidatus Limnocylindria bacterium]|nr:APC family permease [Candidatus Limnocylindria bacterium]
MSTRQAAFIGVGAMVGAGIFSLLGTAGEVAGAAVWLSFVLAGIIAALQGYSFARLGARYPSGAGLLEYINRSFGIGHTGTVIAWLGYASNGIVTAMVAVSFGSYASSAFTGGDDGWVKPFAVILVVAMTLLNIAGSTFVARVQSLVVFVVVGILAMFAIVTIFNVDWSLLAPSGYPSIRHIVSSVALTFFAFLGFGIVTFTARDLKDPASQLPRAMTIAIGVAAVVYVGVSIGVFGTLTVPEVIEAGPTAIAVAAQPSLGDLGYWLMTITALFATAGATNAGLYPAAGLSEELARTGQFPAVMGRMVGGRANVGLLIVAVAVAVLAIGYDLSAIASIGSAVALAVFTLVSIGHLRIRSETGANLWLLLAIGTAGISLLVFVFTTLIQEQASILALIVILLMSIGLDQWWSRTRPGPSTRRRPDPVSVQRLNRVR